MKLLSLKLLNYRRFRQEEIFFQDDFSLIFWKNWAGKSSILDAIWYALFWPSGTDFVRIKTEFLKSHFLDEKQPSKVELTFQYGLKQYRVVRVIDAGLKKFASDFIQENKDTLVWDEAGVILWGTQITSYITQLLWVDKNTFLRSVFAQQKDLEVLSGTREERKNLIHSILWLDGIESLILQVRKLQKEKKTALEYLKNRVQNFDVKKLEHQIQEITLDISEKTKQLQPLLQEKQQLEKDFEGMKKSFEQISLQKEQYLKLQHEFQIWEKNLVSTQSRKEGILQTLKDLEEKEKQLLQYEGIEEKEKQLQKDLTWYIQQKQKFLSFQSIVEEQKQLQLAGTSLSQALSEFDEKILQQDLVNIWESLLKNEQKYHEFLQKSTQLISQLDQITKEANELKQEISVISWLWNTSNCPTCKRPLQEHYPKLMEMFEKTLEEKRTFYKSQKEYSLQIESQLQQQKILLQEEKNKQEILQKRQETYALLLQKFQTNSQNLMQISQKIHQMWEIQYDENAHKNCEQEYEKVKKNLQIFLQWAGEVKSKQNYLTQLTQTTNECELLQKRQSQIVNEQNILAFDEKKFLEEKQKYDTFYEKIREKDVKIHEFQKEILSQEYQLKHIVEQKKNFEQEQTQLQTLKEEVDYLEYKKNILSQYILHLLNYLKPSIEALTSEYFSQITDGKYAQITLDEEYEMLIDSKPLSLYSWWEKDLANLCFRLSLGQNLSHRRGNPINFLVLDEVLGSQDVQRQQNILIHLRKLEHKFGQIFLISHVEEIKEFANHLIEIHLLNKDESTIKSH